MLVELCLRPYGRVLKVNVDAGRVCAVKCVAVVCHMRCGGHFGTDGCLVKINTIITRCGVLAIVREIAVVVLAFLTGRYGHNKDIAQIHTSGTVDGRLHKSPDTFVIVLVIATIGPAHSSSCRSCLDQTEWHRGTGKSVSSGCGTDKRIHVRCVVCSGKCVCRSQKGT